MRGQGPSAVMAAALAKLLELGVVDELRNLGTSGATKRSRAAFDEFIRRTGDDWSRMARELYRRWQLPAAVQPEDVLAELLTAAWRVLPQWNPEGRPLADFVCWNAYAQARKWINAQRDAYRRDGKNQSRHPIAASHLPSTVADTRDATDRRRSVMDQEQSVWLQPAASPEERIDGVRLGKGIAETLPPDEAEAFLLLVGELGSPRSRSPEYRAARKLSGEVRLRNGLGSDRVARGFVGRVQRRAVEIAEQFETSAA